MKLLRIIPTPASLAAMTDDARTEIEARALRMSAAVNTLIENGQCTIEVEEPVTS